MKITTDKLYELIAEECFVSYQDIIVVMRTFQAVVTREIKAGHSVRLLGFGTFETRNRHARIGVNPQNPSEKIKIPAVVVPKFRAGKTLKDTIKAVDK